MASSTATDVFEAELFDSKVELTDPNLLNPFAAPAAPSTSALASVQISDGIGRATEAEIQTQIRSLAASEISFILLCASWILSVALPGQLTFMLFLLSLIHI